MEEKSIRQTIKDFMETKPETINIIGYGSAVKTQTGYNNSTQKQIDIIATVEDSLRWHKQNKNNNPGEYSKFAIQLLKPILHLGTDISYVSDIPYNNQFFKIGVIDKFDFLNDLENWSNFYMAGRTQKPIMLVKSDEKVNEAIKKNRINALKTSLILNTDRVFNEKQLFQTLCSLSYIGDIRMTLGFENPNKVSNIVNGEFDELKNIYSDLNNDFYCIKNSMVIPNIEKLMHDVIDMPSSLVNYLIQNKIDIESLGKEDLLRLREYITRYIKKTNLKSSISQPLKSASINNTSNSIKYLKEKRKKYTSNK